jgi:hypothetical protein
MRCPNTLIGRRRWPGSLIKFEVWTKEFSVEGRARQGRYLRRYHIEIRVLVAFEEVYRTYQGVISSAIRVLRPRSEVETATMEALVEAVERFDPELVICSRPNTVDPGGRVAWVELSVDPTRPSKICVGGRYSESTNPTLEVLLAVIDEVEELIQTNNHFRRC